MEDDGDASVVEARAKAELADRVRAVLRLISPEHITPGGKRQIERVLDRETAGIQEEAVEAGGPEATGPPLDSNL